MKRTTRLKKYDELFKRRIQQYLATGISVKTKIYPVEGEGAVFEFLLNKDGDDSEYIDRIRESVSKVLSEIPQRLVAGNYENFRFGGTNLYLEGNRILVIKGEDKQESWSGSAIADDVLRVVSTAQGSKAT